MLVEKLICNAWLNLLILHPFPTPSQLPQQTGAQWPIYAEVPRNKNIYLQREGEGERRQREGNGWEGQSVGPHVTALDSLGEMQGGGYRCTSHPNPGPIPFANLYLLALYIHLSVTKQNMSRPPPLHSESHQLTPHTHTHPQAQRSHKVKLVKSLKGGERSKGHRGHSLNDCNLW